MLNIRHFILLPVISLSFIIVGCATSAPNILTVQAGPGGLSSKKTEVNSSTLARKLDFGEVSIRAVGPDAGMEAQVIVQNKSKRDVNFEYRFIWYDAKGFEVSSSAPWLPAILGAKEARGFKSSAPNPNAVRFKLMIRKPHPLTDMGT
ncbi:MAG: YcfL family protein [Thermodesulfobacteriota bacterium]|nr:YcfL family protein [Thermodesulfobacteriota bacterium]